MSMSASRNFTTKLGRASTKCGSSVGLARTVTLTFSPPTSRAREPRSGSVATTFSLACAENAQKTIARIDRIFFMEKEVASVRMDSGRHPERTRRTLHSMLGHPSLHKAWPSLRSFAVVAAQHDNTFSVDVAYI